jgi:hypothetical protein
MVSFVFDRHLISLSEVVFAAAQFDAELADGGM